MSIFNASILLLPMIFLHNIVKAVCGSTRLSPSGPTMRRRREWSNLSYFDNVMTKFMINNRTDAWKTDVNLLSRKPTPLPSLGVSSLLRPAFKSGLRNYETLVSLAYTLTLKFFSRKRIFRNMKIHHPWLIVNRILKRFCCNYSLIYV